MRNSVTKEQLASLCSQIGANTRPSMLAETIRESYPVVVCNAQETPEEVTKLQTALSQICPDTGRGVGSIDLNTHKPADYWLGVVWAIRGLNWSCGEKLAQDWSKRSDRYTDIGFEKSWSSYNPSHPNAIGIGSVYRLAQIFEMNSFGPLVFTEDQETHPLQTSAGSLSKLLSFSATGSSQEMRKNMLADIFVMQDIAILGQWTTLYAAPNTGKTLLTLWLLQKQIQAKALDPSKVFYVNADDSYRGAVEKIEIAEQLGMQMLVPNVNEFDPRSLLSMLRELAVTDEARNVVVILDTLKRFTDLMDKAASSGFGIIARQFVSAGGTLICLAHTNKHKDSNGKGIAGGTSDISDDSDCVYIIDKVSSVESGTSSIHTVEFTNKKARGDVVSTASFSYERTMGLPYNNLLNSVKSLNLSDLAGAKEQSARDIQLEEDKEIIESVLIAIGSGVTAKSELINAVTNSTNEGPTKIRRALNRRTGGCYANGDRWNFTVGANNKSEYAILPHPLIIN